MDNTSYTTLNRQSGLLAEMQAVANNIANISTTGFRKERVIFAEHVHALDGQEPSLSMADATGRATNLAQGPLTQTNGTFDFAIEGDGFFMIATADGQRLTRAGTFTPSEENVLVNGNGDSLLDLGGAPIAVPQGAQKIDLATDGTLSADGVPFAQVGVFMPLDTNDLVRAGGTSFAVVDGGTEPMEQPVILQGFLENSNVNPIVEIARMIQVQRAYETGQNFLNTEDERMRAAIQTLASKA